MCGINGVLYFNSYCSNEPVTFFEDKIQKMNSAIAHRGPDGDGMLINYPVSFGHRRLSIIDLTADGAQPMFNEDNSVAIVFNGEIYNYLELIPDLKSKGHILKSRTDTEVIIHAYEEYGFECVRMFNGMWSFAIYDFRKNIFFASRDRFGVKPFYYFIDESQFIFSSEIKAILKIKDIREANHGKVFDYLSYGYKTSNGDTFFKNVKELKGAHNLIIQNDNVEIRRYWDFKREEYSGNEISGKLNFLLHDSVKLRFRSDVPVSILLSGGLDSSIIAKITDEMICTNELNNKDVLTFSAVFPGFLYDESALVTEFIHTCKHLKPYEITPGNESLLNSINDFVYGMGEPVFSTSSFAHYILMNEIKKQYVKVVMNGQGSDEAWCGYGRYIIGYFLLDLLIANPSGFLGQMNAVSAKMKFSNKFLLLQVMKAGLSRRYGSYLRSKYREKIIDSLSFDFFKKNYNYFTNPTYEKFSSGNLSGYMRYNLEYQGFNQILHYEDHSSMQSSIEMRSPFLDYRLMEFAFSLPTEKKIDKGVTKKILRELFKDLLPDSIIYNYNKIGFMTPFDDWMKEKNTRIFMNDLISSDSFSNKKIFNAKKIKKIFYDENNNKDFPFWRIINLELWSKLYNIGNL